MDISKGAEVCTSYGETYDNHDLFSGYGFMQELNEDNIVDVVVELEENDPEFTFKKNHLVGEGGRDDTA